MEPEKRRCLSSTLGFCSRSAWNQTLLLFQLISPISRPSLAQPWRKSPTMPVLFAPPSCLIRSQITSSSIWQMRCTNLAGGGELRLQGFPDFSPLIQGLKESVPEMEAYEYQVCAKRGSKLVVLGSLANKWLQSEDFGAEATSLIENHNKNFNIDGDFVEEETDRTHGTVSPRNPWLSKSLVVLSEICKKLIIEWDSKAKDFKRFECSAP